MARRVLTGSANINQLERSAVMLQLRIQLIHGNLRCRFELEASGVPCDDSAVEIASHILETHPCQPHHSLVDFILAVSDDDETVGFFDQTPAPRSVASLESNVQGAWNVPVAKGTTIANVQHEH